MTGKQFGDYVLRGVSNMLTLVILLVLAFAIGGVIKTLGTGTFLASLIGGRISGAFGPAIIFLLGAVMAFSTGTSLSLIHISRLWNKVLMKILLPANGEDLLVKKEKEKRPGAGNERISYEI